MGRAKGSVLLGQPLKLTVPIRMESDEGPSALCFEADVFYGDTRQDADRVRVASEYLAGSQSANLSVTSLSNVDEPVVTVYVRAGCQAKVSRRFVLLADLATEVLPQPPALAAPLTSSSSAHPTAQRLGPRDRVTVVIAEHVKGNERSPDGARQEPPSAAKPAPSAKAGVLRRPHLKLAPLDLSEDRDPLLRVSNTLVMGDSEDLQKRAQAAAVWRSLNVTPQEVLSAETRRQSMESDLRSLQSVTAKNRQLLEEFSRRLEGAETGRYANPLVLALLAVLLIFSLGLVLAWIRLRQKGLASSPWWRDIGSHNQSDASVVKAEVANPVLVDKDALARDADAPVTMPPETAVRKLPREATEVDIELHLDEPRDVAAERRRPSPRQDHAPDTQTRIPVPSSGHVDFGNSMTAALRSVNTQEMLDVRQQAEFFMTLGQHEEAIAMLRESIDAGFDANPLVYLDLLKILHTLGRKTEYDDYRSGFNGIFSGQVPAYADFNQGGRGLDAYPEVCSCIMAQWPSEASVAYIESCLIHDGNNGAAQCFDLEAFRDLLMLHGVVRRIASAFDSGFLPFSTARQDSSGKVDGLSLAARDGGLRADRTQPIHVKAPPPAKTTVDLDLTEPGGNLIDFDTADLLPSGPRSPSKRQ